MGGLGIGNNRSFGGHMLNPRGIERRLMLTNLQISAVWGRKICRLVQFGAVKYVK